MYKSTRKNRSGSRRFSVAFIKRLSSWLVLSTALTVGTSQCARAASVYWDADANAAGNILVPLAGLGGTGTWDNGITPNWWNGVSGSDQAWNNANLDTAVFTGTAGTVTVDAGGVTAGGLTFNTSGYVLTGGTITLTPPSGVVAPVVAVNGIGVTTTISSQVSGSSQFVKTGDGVLNLTNSTNNFTGNVLVNQGALVISNQAQLGSAALISVNGANQLNNTGGMLVLQGGASGITFSKNLSLSGRGLNYANSTYAALANIGQNTISGNIAFSNATTTAIGNAYGNLTLSGTVGLSSAQNSIFGLGNGNVIVTGLVTGSAVSTDRLIKTQTNLGTSLWLVNSANNYVSDTRIDSGTVRVSTNAALGLSTSATAVDFQGGTLEVLTDSPDFSTRNLRARDNSSGNIFVSRALGGTGLNQNVVFGTLTGININSSLNITGRDGYNVSVGGGVNIGAGGNNNVTFSSGGNGTLTLNTPSLWNNTDTSGSRTLSINGNAETVLTGIINAAPGSSNHNLNKNNQGTFTIQGTTSNFRGNVNVAGGTLSIGSFGAINNNATPGSGALQLNGGALSFTGAAGTGAGETVSKAINLSGTTGSGIILANQAGTAPTALVISNSIAATGAGIKTLFLGGSASSSIVNQINGVIQSNVATQTTSITKVGTATWLYSPSVASYGTAAAGVTVTAGGAAQTNSFTVSSSAGLAVGQVVAGTNVPGGSIITNINGNVITINNNISTAITAATALTFTTNANFTGGVNIGGGTLQVVPTATTGVGSNLFATTQALSFIADNLTSNGSAGGTFRLGTPTPALTAALTQTMGALTLTAGAGRVQVDTGGASFANTLNFASIGTRAAGATVNFAPAATNAGIQFAAIPAGLNGQVGGFAIITNPTTGAVDFVATPGAINTNIAALGAATVLPATGATATTNYVVNTGVTTTAAQAANTIRILGGNNLSLGGDLTITTTSATAIGGILHDNSTGASSITGANLLTSVTNQELIVTTAGTTPANALTIGSVITGNNTTTAGSGGLTKAGSGLLILSGVNTYTGTTTINEGAVQLSGSGTLGGTNAGLLLRQGTTLDLNGVNVGTLTSGGLNAFAGAGTITNSAASGTAFIRVGNNGGGGTFSGIIQDGATAKTQFVKGGGGTVSLSGVNTFTGGVVITGGTLAVNSLPNFGTAGSLGAGIAGNNVGSLVFNGGGTLQYTGSNANIYQTTQTPSVTTDRLFTIDGSGAVTATIDSSGQYGNNTTAAGAQNNAALVFGNTGAIGFAGTGARTIQLTGNSTGDNEFKPLIADKTAVTELTGVTKAGTGLWILSGANTYTGPTIVSAGALQAADGVGLPTASNLQLNGGVFQTTGLFNRGVGIAAGQVQWTGAGGFSAGASKLTVNLGGPLTFGAAAPVNTSTLILSSTTAQADVEFASAIDLGAAARTIQVDDNGQSNFDFATITGVISGVAGGTLTKTGGGNLILNGANTYVGATNVNGGNLFVQSIGAAGATSTSLGTNVGGGALNLGTGGTAGNIYYVGTGETTTRIINLTGTTGGGSIESSGSGALTLTALNNTGVGAKTLTLRGFNTDANTVSANLLDQGTNALSVTKADAGVWLLTGTNTFTGNLTITGLLGANAAAALGAPGTGAINFNNGGLFTNTAGGLTIARATQITANNHATFTGANPFVLSGNMQGNAGNPWTINNTITDVAGLTISGNFNSAEAATQSRTLAIQGTGNTLLSGIIQGTGASNGGVSLVINTAPGATTTLGGASANLMSTGGELRSGILILNKAGALGLSTTTFDLNGGELRTSATVAAQTQNINFRLNNSVGLVNGANPLTMSATLGAIGGNRTFQNDITAPAGLTVAALNLSQDTNARTLTLSGSGTTNITGLIQNGAPSSTNASSLTYSGSGALNISGVANTWTGTAIFNGGTTTVSGAATLGTTGAAQVNQAILTLDNTGTQTNNRLGGRALTLSGATLNVLGNALAGGTEGGAPSTLTIGSGATTINTTNLSGTNILAFTTLTVNTGGFINFTGGVGTATNQVTFSTPPTLSPVTTGILARATVAGADFATYGANGIAAFTGYTTPADLNSAAATDTVKLNATTTVGALTTNKTVNALAFNVGAPTVSNSAGTVLTVTSGGILATGAGPYTISARTNLGAEGAFHVGTGSALNITGVLSGAAGLNKNLSGALNLNTANFVSGATTLNGGTTTLAGGSNTIFPGQTLVVNPGAILDLNGNNQYVQAFGGGNNPGTGGTITSTGAALFTNNGNVPFGGDISGAITMNKTGGSTLTAESALTYTGATWITGGTLTLRDNATLLNTSAININYGTLNLDSNANLQIGNNNRVRDTAAITSRGGTITYQARFAAQGSETMGALTLAEGASTVNINAANNAGNNAPFLSTDVTFASLTRNPGATVNFTANQGFGQNGNANRVFFTTAPTTLANGMLGAWAIANTTDFAAYDPTLGVGAFGYGGFRGYDATFASGNVTQFINNATPTVTNLAAATTTTGALRLGGVSQNDITFSSGGNVLVLETGGLLRSNQAAGSNIGTTASRGVLTAGTGSATELVIYSAASGTAATNTTATTTAGSAVITTLTSTVGLAPGQIITNGNLPTGTFIVSIDSATQITVSQNATATGAANQTLTTGRDSVVVNSVIADNGTGVVTLVKSGAGILNLSANNTYTGGTVFNQGTVNLIGSGVVLPAGGITLNGATLVMNTNAGQIAASNAVTLNDSSTLTLAGNNTLASVTFNNTGGTGTPTVNTGGILTLTGAAPFTVTSNNVSTTPTVNGTVNLTAGAKTLSVGAIQVGGQTVSAIAPAINFAGVINGIGTSFIKTGAGLVQFSGQNTFTGGIDLQAGGLIVGTSSSPTQGGTGLTSGPFGSGAITAAAGTTFYANSSQSFGNAVAFAGTPTFDSTANTVWTLTLNGAISGAGWTATPTVNVINPSLTVALLGNLPAFSNITKTGAGTLIFNSTNYSGNYDATALGAPLAVSLLHDGTSPNIGNGVVQTISLGSVTFGPGTGTVTVGRAGGTLPFPTAANKILAPSSIGGVLANGLIVANNNGYGLSVSDAGALVGTPTFTVNNATASNVTQGLYLTGALSGAGFNKAGAGTLVLTNAGNTFTGNISVNQGVLSVSSDAQLGNAANPVRLNPTAGTSTLRATANITTSRVIDLFASANTRAIEVTSGNTLQLDSALGLTGGVASTLAKNDLGTLILNANNPTWTGGISINQGTVLVNNNTLTTPLGTGTILVSPNAAVIGAALQLAGNVTVTNALNLQGNNNLLNGGINFQGQLDNVSGTNTYSGAIAHPFDATIGARAGSTLNLTGLMTSTGTHRIQFNSEGDINWSGGQTGALFQIDKYGSGTMNISAPITGLVSGSGGIQVHRGTLTLTGTATTNSSGAANLVQSGAILRLDNSGTNTGNRLTGRAVTLQGGTFDFISNSTTELAGALVADQGASTLNNGGAGTSSLTFASFTGNAGSTLNVTGTFGTATNFVKFTAAPALTPATTGILNRVTTNGNEFATYNATNGIVPFTAYAAATNILSATATQTFKATTSTLNSLTSNATLNALNINNTAAVGGLGGNPPVTLTLTSGSIFATGSGGAALNVPIVAFAGSEGIIHVQSGQSLTVNSGMSGTGGLSKDLAGDLNINAQQFVSGTHFINGGTLKLTTSGITNPLLFNQGVAVNTGGTLDLNGQNQFIAGLSSAAAGGGNGVVGGSVTNSALGQSTFTINGNTNFAGVISGNIYLNKTGTGALNLQSAQTYTGPTLITGGTVTLNDNGALPNTSQPIEIRYGGLALANGNLYDVGTRVSDSAPITLVGGSISVAGRQQGISSETFGSVTLAGGQNTLTTNTGGTGVNSLDVTIASLSRTDTSSTIRFNANGQIGSNARLLITTAPTLTNNIIGAWAIDDREFASYDATYGVGRLNDTGFAGYAGAGLNSGATGTDNVRFTSTGTTTLLGNTTVGTLTFGQQNAATVLNLGGNALTIQGGGLLFAQATDNVDFSITNGTLTSGVLNSPSDLFLHHANFTGTNRSVTLAAPIVNNGTGAVRVIFASGQAEAVGANVTNVNGVNTYTGGTVIQSGNVVLGATGQLGTGGFTVNNGTFTQTAGGVIPSQNWTLGGGASVTLAGNNSLTNLTINNNGGGAPTLNPTGVLTLTGVGGIAATVSSPGTISTIAGGTLDLNGNASYPISVGAAIVNGVDVAPWQAGLSITSSIQNGGIVKSGAGLLGLSSLTSTFTGGVNVTAGGIVLGANSTPSSFSGTPFYLPDGVTPTGVPSTVVTSGPLGTGTLTLGANTTVAATTAVTVANTVNITGDVVFNGLNNISFNGLTTLPAIWNTTVTAPQTTVSISDASGSQSTDVINKSGLGTLSVGFYNGTLNIAGGLQFTFDGNTLGTQENIAAGGNVALTSDTAIAVNRSGAAPNARNKNVQKVNLTNNGSIMAVNNQNGYGLEFTGTTSLTGASHFSIANPTASNVVQGLTLSGIVSDTGGFSLVKSGAGTLALTNSGNTFGGVGATIDILNGVLSVSSDGALGNAANTVTLDVDGSTGVGLRATGSFSTARTILLSQPNNAIEVTAGNTLTVTNPFTLAAVANTLTKNDNGVLELSASNPTWNSTVTVAGGALQISNNTAIGTGTLATSGAGQTAIYLSGGVNIANALNLTSTAGGATGINSTGSVFSVSGVNTYSGLITQPSGVGANYGAANGATLNINGAIAASNSATFNTVGNGIVNLNSLYGNGGAGGPTFNKIGTGTLNVTVNQAAVTAAVNVNQGTLNLTGSGVTLGITGTITVGTGATFNVDDTAGAASAHFGNRPLTVSGGTFTYAGNAANSAETNTSALVVGRGGSQVVINQTGGGTVALTFASFGVAADQSGDFSGANLGTASNRLLFTAAPGLTNNILSRYTVGGNSFATYGATNGLAAFTGYNASTNINTPAATDTVDITAAMTTTNLTASKTLNAIRFSNAAGTAIGGAAFNQLTLASGGVLATGGGTNTINVPVLVGANGATAAQMIFHVGSGTTLLNNATLTGTAGMVKDGDGLLTIGSPASNAGITGVNANTLSGTVNVSRGTLRLSGGTNTLLPGVALALGGPAATLDLNGNSQLIGAFLTDSATPNTGGSVIGGSGSQLVINQDNNARNFAGSIGGSVNFVRSGQNTLTIHSANGYTGTTLINGSTTVLQSDGSLSGTSAIDINYAALSADNNAGLTDSTNRIKDSAAITLRGGTLTVQGRAQAASSEALGAVSVNQGFNVINPNVGGTGINSMDVSLLSLSRPAGSSATLIVQGTNLGTIGSNSRVTVGTLNGVATTPIAYSANGSGLTNNIVGGWAENGNDFLTYIPGLGFAALNQAGAAQYDLTNTFVTGTGTKNVRLTATTNINAGGINVNAVSMTGAAINLTFTNAADVLNITSGGLIGPNNNQTIGATVDSGRLTAGGLTPEANSDLYVFNRANTLSINSRIIDNTNGGTSAVRSVFTASGGAISLTNTNNSYTGGTVVNGGTLNLLASTTGTTIPLATTPANGLIINNATVTMGSSTNTVSGQIAAGNIVTLNGVGTLNLFGDNTLAGLVLNNLGGGSGNQQINTFSTATATGAGSTGVLTVGNSGIVATSSNIASQAVIVGRVDFGATAKTIQVDPIRVNGVDVAPLQAAFALQGIVGTAGGINKTGNGVLQLNAQAHYAGPTNVSGGTIRIAVTNAGSRNSALTLASGTFLNLANASAQWGSLAGAGTVFASAGTPTLTVGFDNTDTTFSGQFTRFNDASLGGVLLTKVGTGTMSMTGAQSFATGTTSAITINGGGLRYVDAGAAFPATTVSGGASINLNNGGTLALDNSGTANVNNRLGMNAVGTLNLQGGKLTINGTSTASTPTTETITTLTTNNGGGRVELTANAANPLTLTLTNLTGQNNAGTFVVTGISGAASANGVANLVITTPNLIGGQGGGANGTNNMSVRSDILADSSVAGLGKGFLVRDSGTNNYRALGFDTTGAAVAGEFETTANTAALTNWAGTENVAVTSAQSLFTNTPANTLTFSGTSSIGSGLGAAFGNFGANGALLTQNLSNATGALVLSGTATISTGGFTPTTVGTTVNLHVLAGATLNIGSSYGVGSTGGLIKSDGGVLNLNNKAYYTGVTTINGGTVKLASGGANTLAVIPGAGAPTVSNVALNGTGSVLDLNGQNQTIGSLSSVNPLPGQGGTVTSTAAATLTSTGGGTFGGTIGGALAFTRAGNNTTLLTNANTYTGATIVRGGTLQLRDSGTIASTAGLTLNYGTLNWDNFGLNALATPNPTRIAAANPVTLQGGTFTVNGAGSTDTVLTLNSVTATGGNNNINVLPFINEGSTVKLTIGSLVRSQSNRSGINFNGFTTNNSTGASALGGQGLTQNGQVILNGLDFAMANAVTTAGSNIVTVPSTEGLVVGALVSGTGLPANQRITAITSATTFTITTGTGVTAQASTTINANNLLVNLAIAGGSTVAASNVVTVPSTAGLIVGAPVSGTGLPANSFITAITGPTTFTITTGTGVTAGTGTTFTSNNLNNNLIGGWAVADGSTFATYVTGQGVTPMGQNTGGITAPGFTGTDLSAALVATGNYSDGTSRTLTTGNKTANSIRFAGAGAAQTITPVAGTTYTVGVGFIANQNQATTIGAVDATNTITGAGTDLYFYNNQNTMVVNPAIIGTQALVSNGPATLRIAPLFASNTYSGGTFINNGTTNLQANPGFVAIPGNLTINNANVTLGNATAGQIAPTSVVTINGGGSLNLFSYTVGTSQSLDSLVFNNEGGTGNPAVTFGTPTALSTLTLTNANAITAINNSLATTPTISTSAAAFSALAFSNAAPVITVNAGLAETGLTISAPITSAGGVLTKSGAGVLALSGANTFTTGFALNAGGLMFGASSAGTPPTITSGPVGTGTLTIAGGTSVLSDGTARNIGNAVSVTGDFTFAGVTAGNNLTLSGAMDLGAAGRTLTVTSPAVTATISGAVTSTATAGVGLTKAGNGTLVLGSAANNLNGTGVAVNGGILRNGVNNALPAASNVAISAGAGYDLNNFDQASNTISGSGFITNSANATKTLTVGGTASTSTFAGVITDNRLGQTNSRLALTKTGTGTLTLTGANTYSGNTTVAGTLELSGGGSLGGTAVTVSAGAGNTLKISGNASIGSAGLSAGSVTIAAGANLNLQDGTINTLTLTNPTIGTNLTLSTAALQFDVNATLNTVDKIVVGQRLTLNTGVSTVALNTLAGTFLSNGTYDLMTYASGSTLTGAFNFLSGGTVQQIGSNRSYTLSTSSTALQLIVANNVAANPVYWNGAIDANWNTQNVTTNATNWQTGPTGPDTFALPGAVNDVFFASTAPVGTNLSTTLGQNFSINGLTFTTATTANVSVTGNNLTVGTGGINTQTGTGTHTIASNVVLGGSQTWTIDSANPLTVSGNVTGANALNKAGTGTLVLSGTGNAYGGDTNVNAGTVQLGASNVIPDGAGKGNVSVTGTLDLNGNSDTINGLNGAGTVTNSVAATTSTVTVGGNDATGSFSGVIQNGAGTVGVVKTGTGTQTLSGANTYTGNTDVNAGKLIVSGSLAGNVNVAAGVPNVTLASGNNLTSQIAALSVASDNVAGGTVAPGDTGGTLLTSIGNLSADGNVALGTAAQLTQATLAIEIGGSGNAANAGTNYDLLTVKGTARTVALTNVNLSLSSVNGFTPGITATFDGGSGQFNLDGDKYFVMNLQDATSTLTGTFANQGAADVTLAGFNTVSLGGQLFAISYSADFGTNAFTGGNDVALMAIPEPNSMAMLAGSIGMALGLQRFRRRRSVQA